MEKKNLCFCSTLMSQVQLDSTDLDSARVCSAVNRQSVFICYLLQLCGLSPYLSATGQCTEQLKYKSHLHCFFLEHQTAHCPAMYTVA